MQLALPGLLACSMAVVTALGCSATSSGQGLFGGSGSGSSSSGSSASGSSSGASSASGSSSGGSNSSGGSSNGGENLVGDGAAGNGDGGNGCSGQASDYVYVLSAENDLYSFAPDKKQFTKIGPLACNTLLQPNSMAVDRNAVAYVNYVADDDSTGAIFQVSTQNAGCSGPVLTLPTGWERIGMGYSSNDVSSSAETLYVAAVNAGEGLGLVDFGMGTVNPIGQFTGSLAGDNAELTGTGDGRLFGFFTSDPVQVSQIDKTNGSTLTPVPMTGVSPPSDWAFSFWGGHFYLYTSQGGRGGNGSDVTDYDPVSGSVNTSFMQGIGFDIVGAGVSTCAPVSAPQ